MSAGTVDVRPFEPGDSAGVARLAATVRWASVSDADVVRRVCEAPGSSSYVALVERADGDGPDVVGWAQALGDGVLQSHLSFLVVHPDHRRRGIARLLVVAVFQSTGTLRMDLVATPGEAESFYEGFAHRTLSGYRLYPGQEPD